ncbi:hypothetical protein BD414DRAFT_151481 [Trametes punicea]|nr:hypothetical protein BD414DRAFT_151481 [Trametes punicea]
MRAFDSLYEEPSFEEPSPKERSVLYAVVGAAVTIASTVAAFQLKSSPEWFSQAYVRICAFSACSSSLTLAVPFFVCVLPKMSCLVTALSCSDLDIDSFAGLH